MTIEVIFIILLWDHNDTNRRLILRPPKKYCSSAVMSFESKKFLTFPTTRVFKVPQFLMPLEVKKDLV